MVMMIPFEKRNFNKSLLNYRVCLFRFFNLDSFCCPKCKHKFEAPIEAVHEFEQEDA